MGKCTDLQGHKDQLGAQLWTALSDGFFKFYSEHKQNINFEDILKFEKYSTRINCLRVKQLWHWNYLVKLPCLQGFLLLSLETIMWEQKFNKRASEYGVPEPQVHGCPLAARNRQLPIPLAQHLSHQDLFP